VYYMCKVSVVQHITKCTLDLNYSIVIVERAKTGAIQLKSWN